MRRIWHAQPARSTRQYPSKEGATPAAALQSISNYRVHVSAGRSTLLTVDADEQILVRRAQASDLDAFAILVERHWKRLVGFARSVVGDMDAEDCVQDALVAAWRKLGNLNAPEAFLAWLLRIVARKCVRRAQRGARFVPFDANSHKGGSGEAENPASVDVELMLSLLAPRQRAVMHLTVIEGMTDSEIGAALRISAASVRSHRRRARTALAKLLGQSQADGGTNR